jgi:TPP-dependent indolepyruvate ferredoxin oxidoreductase alpha subunit
VVDAHPRQVGANAEILMREIDHPGVSVVIAVRECKESLRRREREAAAQRRKAQERAAREEAVR